jgi:hypothetical protein
MGFVFCVGEQATAKRAQEYGLKGIDGLGLLSSSGFFASLRMTAGTNNGEDRQQQLQRRAAGFLPGWRAVERRICSVRCSR